MAIASLYLPVFTMDEQFAPLISRDFTGDLGGFFFCICNPSYLLITGPSNGPFITVGYNVLVWHMTAPISSLVLFPK